MRRRGHEKREQHEAGRQDADELTDLGGRALFSVAASASASETAPRMPPHSMTILWSRSIGFATRRS